MELILSPYSSWSVKGETLDFCLHFFKNPDTKINKAWYCMHLPWLLCMWQHIHLGTYEAATVKLLPTVPLVLHLPTKHVILFVSLHTCFYRLFLLFYNLTSESNLACYLCELIIYRYMNSPYSIQAYADGHARKDIGRVCDFIWKPYIYDMIVLNFPLIFSFQRYIVLLHRVYSNDVTDTNIFACIVQYGRETCFLSFIGKVQAGFMWTRS